MLIIFVFIVLASESSSATASKLFLEVYAMLKTYWIVVVLASFLLVILVGQPSALKAVYLISLYIFLLFYQVTCVSCVVISSISSILYSCSGNGG